MVGVAAGLAAILLVRFETPIAWTWYVLIGTVVTFLTALAASLLEGKRERPPGLSLSGPGSEGAAVKGY
jgi:hypothetical protein